MKREQAATASALTVMGSDLKQVVTKVDVTEEVGATKKLREKTNIRVEEAIQVHVKKMQQMRKI